VGLTNAFMVTNYFLYILNIFGKMADNIFDGDINSLMLNATRPTQNTVVAVWSYLFTLQYMDSNDNIYTMTLTKKACNS
jgi:hypothetical protein